MINLVSLQPDEYIHERELMWIAELSNGQAVYQDDGRPGVEPVNAWLRLKRYVEENDLRILSVRLEFRSNAVHFPTTAEGYFFRYGASSILFSNFTIAYYIFGVVENGKVKAIWYKVPELIPIREKEYTLEESEESLILNGSPT